ncbi:hypothetical protein V2G26_021181 [Clonostachys chloroleuca]
MSVSSPINIPSQGEGRHVLRNSQHLDCPSRLGELAAIFPTAGGQYHFVYALCTEKWRNLTGFVVGWINIAGWLTLVTTEGFFADKSFSCYAYLR